MKLFKILRSTFLVLAMILFLASLVVCGVNVEGDALFFATISAYVGLYALATVGVFLMTSANDTAKRVGHALAISSFTIGLAISLMFVTSYSVAAVIMLISVVLMALQYLCMFVLAVMKKHSPDATENPNEDIRVIRVREWKHIMEEGIISAEEYEQKRTQILGISAPSEPEKD